MSKLPRQTAQFHDTMFAWVPLMLKVQCPGCKKPLQVAPQNAGQAIRCPLCGQVMKLPPAAPPSMSSPAVPPVSASPLPPPPKPAHSHPPSPPPTPAPEPDQEELLELVAPAESPGDFPELGGVVRVYRPRNWLPGLLISAGLLVLALPLLLVAGLTGSQLLLVPSVLLGLVGGLGVITCGIYFVICYKRLVELREHGLVSRTYFGSTGYGWKELQAMYVVRTGIPSSTELHFDLPGEKTLVLPGEIRELADLAAEVTAATSPLITARINRALDRGEEVAFGKFVSVAPGGLRFWPNGRKGEELRLRWREIGSIIVGRVQANPGDQGLGGGVLQTQMRIVPKDGPFWPIASGNVANFSIFLELIERLSGIKPEML